MFEDHGMQVYYENNSNIIIEYSNISDYVERVAIYLGIDQINFSLSITLESEGISWCCGDNEHIEMTVNVNNLAQSLAHEFVHVKQLVCCEYINFVSDLPESEKPWEIEAYDKEDKIVKACLYV